MTTISMDTSIIGMAISGRTIYYSTWDDGLKMLNLSDQSVSNIINSNTSNVRCVATSGDKLEHTYRDMLRFTWYNTMGIQRYDCSTGSMWYLYRQ